MITLEKIKQDVADGKSPLIYYSAHTLWWTHLEEDVRMAMAIGSKARDEQHAALMKREDIPEEEKAKMKSLFEMANSGAVEIPCDPTGSPPYQTEEVDEWISRAEAKPDHFGRHGIEAFVKSHHQNCDTPHSKWEEYNKLLD